MIAAFYKSWKDSFSQSQLCPLFNCSSANMNKYLHVWIFALRHICSMLDRTSWWKINVNGEVALERHSLSSPAKSWDGPKHPAELGCLQVHMCLSAGRQAFEVVWWSQHYCLSVTLVTAGWSCWCCHATFTTLTCNYGSCTLLHDSECFIHDPFMVRQSTENSDDTGTPLHADGKGFSCESLILMLYIDIACLKESRILNLVHVHLSAHDLHAECSWQCKCGVHALV